MAADNKHQDEEADDDDGELPAEDDEEKVKAAVRELETANAAYKAEEENADAPGVVAKVCIQYVVANAAALAFTVEAILNPGGGDAGLARGAMWVFAAGFLSAVLAWQFASGAQLLKSWRHFVRANEAGNVLREFVKKADLETLATPEWIATKAKLSKGLSAIEFRALMHGFVNKAGSKGSGILAMLSQIFFLVGVCLGLSAL